MREWTLPSFWKFGATSRAVEDLQSADINSTSFSLRNIDRYTLDTAAEQAQNRIESEELKAFKKDTNALFVSFLNSFYFLILLILLIITFLFERAHFEI